MDRAELQAKYPNIAVGQLPDKVAELESRAKQLATEEGACVQ